MASKMTLVGVTSDGELVVRALAIKAMEQTLGIARAMAAMGRPQELKDAADIVAGNLAKLLDMQKVEPDEDGEGEEE